MADPLRPLWTFSIIAPARGPRGAIDARVATRWRSPDGRGNVEVVDGDEFLELVAQRTGLEGDGARRATDAVLETLAERIAGGEVDDLAERLPMELHPALHRGRDASGGQATRPALDAFVHRIAEREDVSDLEAARHARAVLLTLRETVGEDEFLDVTAQLPADYIRTLAR